ncbi:MAG: 50S ribosomal protein L13, partial [Verrucomicrobiota bacterium]
MKTTLVQEKDVERQWHHVDAAGQHVGRLAVKIANILRGKNRPTYAPHIDGGDFVVVTNVEQIKFTGMKEEQKIYQKYTGYVGGLKEFKASYIRETHPDLILRQAVKGMLPRNSLSKRCLKRLKIYAGTEHPH